MRRHRWLAIALLIAGCSSSHSVGDHADLGVPDDLAVAPDLAVTEPQDIGAQPELASRDLTVPSDLKSPPDLTPLPLPTGAFGVWHLDGDATDTSGNGNNGTVHGTFTSIANRHGVAGKAVSFDGATDITFGSTTSYFSTALRSVSFWIEVVAGAAMRQWLGGHQVHLGKPEPL